jgi:hypothetical protein
MDTDSLSLANHWRKFFGFLRGTGPNSNEKIVDKGEEKARKTSGDGVSRVVPVPEVIGSHATYRQDEKY